MDQIDKPEDNPENNDPWASLKGFTAARIAIGRTGDSIPLQQMLDFKLAHAHARDAVYSNLDVDVITAALQQFNTPIYKLHSKATDRQKYLKRPDYGRMLDEPSAQALQQYHQLQTGIAIIIADGLSATAINQYAVPFLQLLIPQLLAAGIKLAPINTVEQARVAIADEIGFALKAQLSLILIGERPGLTSPDSMSAYLTYNPKPGLTDESRNCISNIRPEGLSLPVAAGKLLYLITQSLQKGLTGVELKDNQGLLG